YMCLRDRIGSYYCIAGKKVFIGNNVSIAPGAWIMANPVINGDDLVLRIEEGCNIGRFNEIYATKSIILEEKVLLAERIYISDNLHSYAEPDIPILDQPVIQNKSVRIGKGSWVGSGASILGANIGKHCVIGANAVVTHDIPDYCVAVGMPAKIIKRYNPLSSKWEKTKPDGSFLS
ncbi:MAG: acyltransferase, partial [Muribaculaceae bacterium]|nr:acyltransferase [Muribaculaceae bacterium]